MVLITPPEPSWIPFTGFTFQAICICVFVFLICRWWRALDHKETR